MDPGLYAEDNVIAVPRCIVFNDIPTLASMPQPFMCCSFYVRSVNRSIVRVLTSCLRNVDSCLCVFQRCGQDRSSWHSCSIWHLRQRQTFSSCPEAISTLHTTTGLFTSPSKPGHHGRLYWSWSIMWSSLKVKSVVYLQSTANNCEVTRQLSFSLSLTRA